MRLTKTQLKQIIKEETEKVLFVEKNNRFKKKGHFPYPVIVFSAPGCGACKTMIRMLKYYGITVEEKNISKSSVRILKILKKYGKISSKAIDIPIPVVTIRNIRGKMSAKDLTLAMAVPASMWSRPFKLPAKTKHILCGAKTGTIEKCSDPWSGWQPAAMPKVGALPGTSTVEDPPAHRPKYQEKVPLKGCKDPRTGNLIPFVERWRCKPPHSMEKPDLSGLKPVPPGQYLKGWKGRSS